MQQSKELVKRDKPGSEVSRHHEETSQRCVHVGKAWANKWVFSWLHKDERDVAERMCSGSKFHNLGAAYAKLYDRYFEEVCSLRSYTSTERFLLSGLLRLVDL